MNKDNYGEFYRDPEDLAQMMHKRLSDDIEAHQDAHRTMKAAEALKVGFWAAIVLLVIWFGLLFMVAGGELVAR
jgi:hypothetical protein